MLLILQPGTTSVGHLVTGHSIVGYAFAAGGTFCGATMFIIVGHVGKAASPATGLFYVGWICTGCMGLVMLLSPEQRISLGMLGTGTTVLLLSVGVRLSRVSCRGCPVDLIVSLHRLGDSTRLQCY